MRGPRLGCALAPLLVLLEAASTLQAQSPWRWTPLVGEPVVGVVQGPSADGSGLRIALPDGGEIELAWAQLDRGEPVEKPAANGPPEVSGTVWLRDGSRLPVVRLAGAPEEGLLVEPAGMLGPLELPRSVWTAFAVQPLPAGFAAARLAPEAGQDLLFAEGSRGVQRLGVEVLAVTAAGLDVSFRGRQRPTLPWAKVAGVVLAAASPLRAAETTVPSVALQLQGGGRVSGRIATWGPRRVQVRAAGDVLLPVDPAAILRLDVASPRRTWLSSLEPVTVEQQPALDRTWPWLVDRAPGGPGIQLGGKAYSRGLVLVPRTRLGFGVGGEGYGTFRAVLGLDDRAGPAGHAVMRILGDGRLLFSTGPISAGDLPQRVQLDIRGIEELTLEVDFGDRLDLGDHCAFADAALLRDGSR